ncbi:MAG: two-component regulator propeller domain-containing protein [Planctomycetota bacterium]|nr:two-component regulator propeller domain-containing protein [Planctomycetota bacterium]
MHIPIALLALTLFAGSPPHPASPDSGSQDKPKAEQQAPTQQETPKQLAEYPGAPFEDSEGNHWFGTVLEGLIRFDGEEFVNFTTEDGLAGNLIRGIVQAKDGSLWIGTNDGVSVYDGKSFTTLSDYGDLPITRTFSQAGDHRDIWEVLQDRNGRWWIATLDGVFRFDGKAFSPFPMPAIAAKGAFEFTPKMVYSIFEAKDGALWFGTDGAGAVRYDGGEWTRYTKKSHGLCSDRVCTILEDSRGDVWFGTSDGGVSRFDGKTMTTHFRSATHSKHTGWGRFMAIHEDRLGHVWFGASVQGGGVYRFDGEEFRYFSVKDGLGTGGVPSIKEDRSGKLWFGTTSGVYRFEEGRFVNFTRKD